MSIGIWHNLSTEKKRDELLDASPQLRKAWRASIKRFDAADDSTKARIRFERSWLYTAVLDLLALLYTDNAKPGMYCLTSNRSSCTCSNLIPTDQVVYCERFIEFLTDLLGQLPTRRYANTLLQDLHVLPALTLSPLYSDEDGGLLRDLYELMLHYTYFTIDDQTGAQQSRTDAYNQHCARLSKLQRVSLQHFEPKLKVLALSNYGSIDKRPELTNLLEPLTDEETVQLCSLLSLRTSYPESAKLAIDRRFLTEVLLSTFEKRKTYEETAQDLSILPNEESLFEHSLARTNDYDGSRPLAIPKLNLQYLSAGDFLWRSLVLYRSESFYGIRQDIENAIRRLKPEVRKGGETVFTGTSRMALPISKPRYDDSLSFMAISSF